MPLNTFGWTNEEDEKLVDLVKPYSYLYILDPSRKNILAREKTWEEIARVLSKPVEECRKRWRGIRDFYIRSKRMGTTNNTKVDIFGKLSFLDAAGCTISKGLSISDQNIESTDEDHEYSLPQNMKHIPKDEFIPTEENVITDNQEYYEITVVEGSTFTTEQKPEGPVINIVPTLEHQRIPQKRGRKCGGGRKKTLPIPKIAPIKILPKPIIVSNPNVMSNPKIVVDNSNTSESRSQVIDKLIERVLKENTNEIDVFFRSMAASVKKLQPNLIPKVKMEVCNVIAKYEMQSFDKKMQNF